MRDAMPGSASASLARLSGDTERSGAGTLSGAVVSDFMVVMLVLLAVVGAVTGRPLVSGFAGVVFLIALVARLWARLALEEIHFRCTPSYRRVLVGETFVLTIVIENRKPLPLPWLRVTVPVRSGLVVLDEDVQTRPYMGGTEVELLTSLGPYDRVTTRLRLRAVARGCYPLEAVTLSSGDLFGFYGTRRETPPAADALLACPRTVPLPELALPSIRPLGDAAGRRRLSQDPDRPNGVREYRTGDPVKHIDWKTTARRAQPFVRTHDPSVAHHVVIALECDPVLVWRWGAQAETLEACVVLAASVAEHALALGYRVGLVANGIPAGLRARAVVPPGRGPAQWPELMDALARVQGFTLHSLPRYLETFGARALPAGATVVYVTGMARAVTVEYLSVLATHGYRVQMLLLGDDESPAPSAGIPVLRLAQSRFAPREHGQT
ncbi:MAG: DUF58 domain-containing protein [Gammaproteobacteria bacterium]|nr:DUF58 domain-containing protein [Gammaproteobacteria bacterium]